MNDTEETKKGKTTPKAAPKTASKAKPKAAPKTKAAPRKKPAVKAKEVDATQHTEKKTPADKPATSSRSKLRTPLIILLVAVFIISITYFKAEHDSTLAANETQADSNEQTASKGSTSTEAVTIQEKTPVAAVHTENSGIASDDETYAKHPEKLSDESQEVQKQTAKSTNQATTTVSDNTNKVKDSEKQTAERHEIKKQIAAGTDQTTTTTTAAATSLAVSSGVDTPALNKTQQQTNNMGTKPSESDVVHAVNQVSLKPAYASRPDNTQARSQIEERAKKHNEMMQQRRQGFEKERQLRQQQHASAAQAREEQRAQYFQTRKDMFQRAQQNRMEKNKRLQDIHKRISGLHAEVHQIIRDSRDFNHRPPTTPLPRQSAKPM